VTDFDLLSRYTGSTTRFIPTTKQNGAYLIYGNVSDKCRRIGELHLWMIFIDAQRGEILQIEAEEQGEGELGDGKTGIVPRLNESHLKKWGIVTLAPLRFAAEEKEHSPCPLLPSPLLLVHGYKCVKEKAQNTQKKIV
jgi:hypothetical protein